MLKEKLETAIRECFPDGTTEQVKGCSSRCFSEVIDWIPKVAREEVLLIVEKTLKPLVADATKEGLHQALTQILNEERKKKE